MNSKLSNSASKLKKTFLSKHPVFVPIVTLLFLFILSGVGFFIYGGEAIKPTDSKIITLYLDDKRQTIPTRASTVGEFLERSNIDVQKEDLVEPSLGTPISSEHFAVNIYRAKQVTVIDENGKKVVAKIADTTPVVMASQAGFKLYPEDIVKLVEPDISLDQGIIGSQVVIDRAVLIKMNLYGKNYNIRTHAETVAELAEERGLDYSKNSILPKPNTKLKPGEVVFITDPGKKIARVEEQIPNEEEVISDSGLEQGETIVRTEGSPGKKVVIYEVSPSGERILLQEVIISQPVKRVVVEGRKLTAPNVSVASDKAALMSAAGIPADQHASVDYIISRESGWRPAAVNPSGLYVGLGQTNPASLSASCPDWQTNAVCQLQHFNGYAINRYGSWNEAYAFWSVNHWW